MFNILKRCYRHASVRATNPSQTYMEKVRWDLQTLYHMDEPHPPGLPLATHVNQSKVSN